MSCGGAYDFPAIRSRANVIGCRAQLTPSRMCPVPFIRCSTRSSRISGGLVVTKRLDASEWIVDHHRVNGTCVLPAVATLEMVRAACEVFGKIDVSCMSDIAWSKPILVENGPVILEVSVRREHGLLGFTISSDCGVHCRGSVQTGNARADPLQRDLTAIGSPLAHHATGSDFYERLTSRGFGYGERMRGIDTVRYDDRRALAKLSGDFDSSMLLHPCWMDAALQATAAILGADGAEPAQMVPAALGKLRRVSAEQPAWVHVERLEPPADKRSEHFNIEVLSADGTVVVRFEDFSARPLIRGHGDAPDVPAAANLEGVFYVPRWRRMDASQGPADLRQQTALIVSPPEDLGLGRRLAELHGGRVFEVVLGDAWARDSDSRVTINYGSEEDMKRALAQALPFTSIYFLALADAIWEPSRTSLRAASGVGVLSLLKLVRALLRLGRLGPPHDVCILTTGAHQYDVGDQMIPAHGPLLAFHKALAQEHPELPIRTIDLSLAEIGDDTFSEQLATALQTMTAEFGSEFLLRGGRMYRRQLESITISPPHEQDLPLRRRGVYVIFGGAGGIGQEIAAYLALKQEARIVLVGRSAERAEHRELIKRLNRMGAQTIYLSGDVVDVASVREVQRRTLDRFGAVHGIIHAAIVLRDRTIANIDDNSFAVAFDPKVYGTAAIDEVFGSAPLDFIVLFSTGSTLTGGRGQSNYISGSGFKDSYARYLRSRGKRAQTINWGFWRETGIVASPEYRERIERQGVFGFTTQEGVAAFEQILASDLDQVLAIKLRPDLSGALGIDPARTLRAASQRCPKELVDAVNLLLSPSLPARRINVEPLIASLRALVRSRLPRVLAELHKLGFPIETTQAFSGPFATRQYGIAPQYGRLLEALLALLQRHGLLIDANPHQMAFANRARDLLRGPEKTSVVAEMPDHAALLDRSIAYLAGVLRDARPPPARCSRARRRAWLKLLSR